MGKDKSRDSLAAIDNSTASLIPSTTPLDCDADASNPEFPSTKASLKAADVARERRGASSAKVEDAIGSETYKKGARNALGKYMVQETGSANVDGSDSKILPIIAHSPAMQTKITCEEVARMRKNELPPIAEELEPLAEPERSNHSDFMIKYAHEWPRKPDDRLALRRLRLGAFREYQKRRVKSHSLDWIGEGEICVSGEILLGGNCVADAELFDVYEGPVRHLESYERQHYKNLYGFLPEEVKAFRDKDDLVLSINRAASVQMKAELHGHETKWIKINVQNLYKRIQSIDRAWPGLPTTLEREQEAARLYVRDIELQWLDLMGLAAKRRSINIELLDAAARGDMERVLLLARVLKNADVVDSWVV